MKSKANLYFGVAAISLAMTWAGASMAQDAGRTSPTNSENTTETQTKADTALQDAQEQAKQDGDTSAEAQQLLTGKPSAVKTAIRKAGEKGEKAAAKAGPKVVDRSGRLEGDIVVVGQKETLASARSAKRRAEQIVDVILAEDIAKLPDRNVAEAIARLPGVQITRTRGEGSDVRIRGLSNVLTTVNGSQTFTGADRGAALNTLSSDLVAAVEVFKTRTPDQLEGSQSGVVNVTLRRPTDFKEGVTYSLSMGGDYSDQVKRINPNANAIISYTGDTAIGPMGFMVNGSYNFFKYNEAIRWNGFPGRPGDNRQIVDPSTTPVDIYMPGNVGFSGQFGQTKRVGLQTSADWRPDDNLHFVVEGGFSNSRGLYTDNQFDMDILSPFTRLTNIVMNEDGRSVKSVSVDGTTPIGPGRQSWKREDRNYNARFQVDYTNERIEATAWINYAKSIADQDGIFHWIRFNQQPQYDVTFNTDRDPRGGPDITFKNIDLLDPANYRYIDGFDQTRIIDGRSEREFKADLRFNTFLKLIDWFKVGIRQAQGSFSTNYGRRVRGDLRIPISSLPDYELTEIGRGFSGTQTVANANWLIGDHTAIRRNWTAILSKIQALDPDYKNYYPKFNPSDYVRGGETNYTAYAMFHYNLKLLFPIEGVIGARIVNNLNDLKSRQRLQKVTVVNGISTDVIEETDVESDANFLNVIPSINGIVHFTPKLQLRLSYTGDVQRPWVGDLNPQLVVDVRNPGAPTANGGNPNLKGITTSKYDASLEWYFGRTGLASIAVWQWNQDGYIGRRALPELLPEGLGKEVLVERPFNLGRGRYRGIEIQASTFFTFLPGILKSIGASGNWTLNTTRQAFPSIKDKVEVFEYGPILGVSKYMYNLAVFYENKGLNLRLAYNWQSRRQEWRDAGNPFNNQFFDPFERLDASISYDISKNFQIAAQANNLTADGSQLYWGSKNFPRDIRYFARQFNLRATARF